MKILSIDTSSEVCSVAILEDKNVLKEINIENGNTHSQNLMPLISKILHEENLEINDIDLFTCDNGPGSFTGIRIGVATLKAFRDVTNKNIIGVSSLKTLAYNVKEENYDYVCSIIDAKNNNIYYGIFYNDNGIIKKALNYGFTDINSLLNCLKTEKFLNKKIFFVGNASIVYKDVIQSVLEKNVLFSDDISKNKLNAVSVAIAAIDKLNMGKKNFDVTPLYLKKSSAEELLERK